MITYLYDTIYFQQKRYAQDKTLNNKIGGQWKNFSSNKIIEEVELLTLGLLNKGIKQGDQIAIVSQEGSPEWFVMDIAIMLCGAISVPLYPNYKTEELKLILEELELKMLFCQNTEIAEKFSKFIEDNSIHQFLFYESESYNTYRDLFAKKRLSREEIHRTFDINISTEDVATIIYTSGSEGMPKGVMLSHRNMVSNIRSMLSLLPMTCKERAASFLPLSHIFERIVIYTYISFGTSVYFVSDRKNMFEELGQIKPHFMSAVPRILENFYAEILLAQKEAKSLKKWIIKMATKSAALPLKRWYHYPLWKTRIVVSELLVYRQWRKLLGGNIKAIVVGAASLDAYIARVFTNAGIAIKEGYGLTETSPVIAFNRFEPGGTRFGTVGIPIPGVEVKIVDANTAGEGEIIVRGPNIMVGYYKNKQLTEQKISKDGWFWTGDVGQIIDGRFLKITDRNKDIIKNSSGKYVYPQKIESFLKSYLEVDQCICIGFQKPYIAVLIIPNFGYLEKWCGQNNVHWTAPLYMVENTKVLHHFQSIIDDVNTQLYSHEYIKKFKLLYQKWSIETGEYSQTLKLKRREISKKYNKEIKSLYE